MADRYRLSLYVNRSTLKSRVAIANLHRVCEQHLKGRYDLEVIDVEGHAQRARNAQIVAVPTLIKRLPPPFQRLVGDMSDVGMVLQGLSLTAQDS